MKIETQPRDDHQVTIIAEIEQDVFEKSKRQAARKISRETKIPGFRPGKAPFDIVRRMFGEDAIEKEAVNQMIDEVYPQVIEQAEVEPYGPGNLLDIHSTNPPVFHFLVPLKPTIELGDYKVIRKDYELGEVDEKEVTRFIDQVRGNSGTIVPVERPAEEGDMVTINISGARLNPAEGEETNLVKERPYQTMIREADMALDNEWPYPGFNRELIGVSAGDGKTILHTFSDDTPYESLKGKEVEFQVQIQSVKKLELPELTTEFVQTLGEFESVEKFQESVREQLEYQAKDEYERAYFSSLIDQIIEEATIKYPPQALDDEVEQVLHNIENDLAQQNLDLDTYLKIRNTDKESFIDSEIKPAAIKRLKRSLVLDELARVENIQFDNAQFETAFGEAMIELQGSQDFNQMRKKLSNEQMANAVAMEAASRVINRQIFDRLKLIATGQDTGEVAPAEEPSSDNAQSETEEAAEEATVQTDDKETEG